MRSSAARAAHREALALGSSAPLRSSAARAALREALALGSSAPLRSSAARAALRGASPLPHLLQRAIPVRPWLSALAHDLKTGEAAAVPAEKPRRATKAKTMAYQAMARCNKCGSGLAPRSAARAALDLKGAKDPKASASPGGARPQYPRKNLGGHPGPTPHQRKVNTFEAGKRDLFSPALKSASLR